jgi:hypothetical protein
MFKNKTINTSVITCVFTILVCLFLFNKCSGNREEEIRYIHPPVKVDFSDSLKSVKQFFDNKLKDSRTKQDSLSKVIKNLKLDREKIKLSSNYKSKKIIDSLIKNIEKYKPCEEIVGQMSSELSICDSTSSGLEKLNKEITNENKTLKFQVDTVSNLLLKSQKVIENKDKDNSKLASENQDLNETNKKLKNRGVVIITILSILAVIGSIF